MGTRVDEARAAYERSLVHTEYVKKWCRNTLSKMQPPASLTSESEERARMRFREAVILEGANVDCRAVRDGGG
jgi:hypothetical protein